jgi:phage terminase small subunit
MKAAWFEFDRIAARFGLTPSDRAKLSMNKKEADDPLLKMMGG